MWCRAVVSWPGGADLPIQIAGEGEPGLAAVDVLARLAVAVRRGGGSLRLEQTSRAFGELIDLVGLRREVGGQGEGGEEVRCVEEGMDP